MFFNLNPNRIAKHLFAAKSADQSIQSQKGVSNVALGITLIVGAVIAFAGIKMFPKINESKVNAQLDIISNFKSKTVEYGQVVAPFAAANVTATVLNGQGFFPTGSYTTGATANNQFGGTISPAVGTVQTLGDAIVFTETSYPQSACNTLGLKLDGIADAVSINATTTKAVGGLTNATTVATACIAGNNNIIAYTLSK